MSKKVEYLCDGCRKHLYGYLWKVDNKHYCYNCYIKDFIEKYPDKIDVISIKYSGKRYIYLSEANIIKVNDIVLVRFGSSNETFRVEDVEKLTDLTDGRLEYAKTCRWILYKLREEDRSFIRNLALYHNDPNL